VHDVDSGSTAGHGHSGGSWTKAELAAFWFAVLLVIVFLVLMAASLVR
jgi:hypothetical protein